MLDAADVGGKFSIKVGDTLYSNLAGAEGKLRNGNVQLVKILLSEAVTNLTVELMHDRTNDGFGIDGAAVGLAPIPLPPAALLLGSGLAGPRRPAPPQGGRRGLTADPGEAHASFRDPRFRGPSGKPARAAPAPGGGLPETVIRPPPDAGPRGLRDGRGHRRG